MPGPNGDGAGVVGVVGFIAERYGRSVDERSALGVEVSSGDGGLQDGFGAVAGFSAGGVAWEGGQHVFFGGYEWLWLYFTGKRVGLLRIEDDLQGTEKVPVDNGKPQKVIHKEIRMRYV